jgi:hypothetical protein
LTVIQQYSLLVNMKATIPDWAAVGVEPRQDREIPPWFGALNKTARGVTRHDMSAIRESIAHGIVQAGPRRQAPPS